MYSVQLGSLVISVPCVICLMMQRKVNTIVPSVVYAGQSISLVLSSTEGNDLVL